MARTDNRDFSGTMQGATPGMVSSSRSMWRDELVHDEAHLAYGHEAYSYGDHAPYSTSSAQGSRDEAAWRTLERERAMGRYDAFQHDEEKQHTHGGGLQEAIQHGVDKLRETFHGKGPKSYVRSNERIHDEVCEALSYDSYVDASDVEVQVEDGEVTLAGTVHDRLQKRRAEQIAEAIRGVHDVHNRLRVVATQAASS
jgi:hypothetical protein